MSTRVLIPTRVHLSTPTFLAPFVCLFVMQQLFAHLSLAQFVCHCCFSASHFVFFASFCQQSTEIIVRFCPLICFLHSRDDSASISLWSGEVFLVPLFASLYLLVCLFVFLFGCPLVNDCLPVWVLNVCMSCDRCEDAPQRHRPHDDNREINALSPHHYTQLYPQNHTHTVPCRTHIPIPIPGPYKVAPSHITITTVCQAKLKQMCHSKPYKVGLK